MKKTSIVLLTAVSLLAACSTVPITGRHQLSLVSQSELASAASDQFKQLLTESKLSSDTTKTYLVVSVGSNIARVAEEFLKENGKEGDIKNFSWEFKLIDDDNTVNAFCMPGGKVAVYTGIMPLTKDQNGLAVVIGHEVAHAIANHGGERMSQSLLTQLGGTALSTALKNKPEQTQQLFMSAYGVGANVGLILPYSRSHEYEADHIGLILMARAGYDPTSAVEFWQRMSSLGGSQSPEFLSTHPSDDKRIENLKKELSGALQYYKQ